MVLRAAAQDPDTSETIVADLTITVGPGVSTGQPALTNFLIIPSPLYITGQGREDVKRFQVQVLDDAGQPVPNPAGNNLQLQLLPSRPNGGEKLVAITGERADIDRLQHRLLLGADPVSYTHLDVYKRQQLCRCPASGSRGHPSLVDEECLCLAPG